RPRRPASRSGRRAVSGFGSGSTTETSNPARVSVSTAHSPWRSGSSTSRGGSYSAVTRQSAHPDARTGQVPQSMSIAPPRDHHPSRTLRGGHDTHRDDEDGHGGAS